MSKKAIFVDVHVAGIYQLFIYKTFVNGIFYDKTEFVHIG